MLKENGRLAPSSDKETASAKKSRPVVCTNCQTITIVEHVEFGEEIRCAACNQPLPV
jgi:uncharacterized paraquat-inducible protein A